jgi:hypothetical protein
MGASFLAVLCTGLRGVNAMIIYHPKYNSVMLVAIRIRLVKLESLGQESPSSFYSS